MVFSSNVFLIVFLPIFLTCYFLCPKRWRNLVLLLFSIVFYAYGSPTFIFLLLGSIVLNYYLVKLMYKSEKQIYKKIFSGLAILASLGLLLYFKYANFFADNLNALLTTFGLQSFSFSKVLLPIGISFFTFQSITYVVDAYRGNHPPMERLSDYMLYIIMFPQLIAGPIVRYCDIADDIRQREQNWAESLQGFYRFVIGLSKKVLVADVIGKQADILLAGDLTTMNTGTAWIAIIAYTMQLYFDFSGYSDMAIGLGKIMGFHFLKTSTTLITPQVSTSFGDAGTSPWAPLCATISIFPSAATAVPNLECTSTSGWCSSFPVFGTVQTGISCYGVRITVFGS